MGATDLRVRRSAWCCSCKLFALSSLPLQLFMLKPLTSIHTHRRLELTEGLKSAEGIAALRAKHPIEIVTSNLLNYVSTARQALGPPLLKVCLPLCTMNLSWLVTLV